MPLSFKDVLSFLTPETPVGAGNDSIHRALAGIRESAARRAELDEQRRQHDLYDSQMKRQVDASLAGQQAAERRERMKAARDLLEEKAKRERAQANENEDTMIEAARLAMVNPTMAQALLANRGLLANKPGQGATAQTSMPQSAGYTDITTTPEDFTISSGGKDFEFSKKAQIDKHAAVVTDLFTRALGSNDKNPDALANRVISLAPSAVEAADGDTKEALDIMFDFYNNEQGRSLKKKPGSSGAGGRASKPKSVELDERIYSKALTHAKSDLTSMGLYALIDASTDAETGIEMIMSNNGTAQFNAIKRMIRSLDPRISNLDLTTAAGYMSVFKDAESWLAENTGSALSEDKRDQIAQAMRITAQQLNRIMKDVMAPQVESRIKYEPIPEYRKAYGVLYNSKAGIPRYKSWFKPVDTGDTPEVDKKGLLDKIEAETK